MTIPKLNIKLTPFSRIFVVVIFAFLVTTGIIATYYLGGLGKIILNKNGGPIVQNTIIESDCAKSGERSVSNFNMTIGKINPNIKAVECCLGLKNIAEKQSGANKNPRICGQRVGVPYNLCAPCGNGKCDTQYEDFCNCPEDCK